MGNGTLEFKVGSLLKNIIGRDLITDDYIAVFELVKNSFDAHAKNVTITFEDDKILIADDGKGMSLSDLENKWLFVAYSAKYDGTEDEEFEDDNKKESYRDKIQVRKHYAGAKGIGRFSCDRLGEHLKLITRKISENETSTLNVNWNDFEEDPKEEFRKVKVKYASETSKSKIFPDNSENGTILEISKLSGNWTRKKLLDLKHSLEKLINPFSETDEFNIEIVCKREEKEDKTGKYKSAPRGAEDLKGKPYLDRDKVNGKVKNSILDVLDLKTTQINVTLTKTQIRTSILDRGTLIYKIEEPNNDYSLIDSLQMDLYFLNTSAKNNFTRRMGVQVVNFGSVFLFKNGFRVQPYGEVGDDSWGLDYRTQQGYKRYLGTRDLFGRVDITTDDTIQFKEVTSRDGGLVETKGYAQLVEAFKEKALKRLERYVVGVLWGEGFKRRNYFGKGSDADSKAEVYRKQLQDSDKHSDDIEIAKSNLGSKLDFIQIIKSLANDKDVQILDYNEDLIDLVNENLDDIQTKFFSDIEVIAEKTDNADVKKRLKQLEKNYAQLQQDKIKAEKKAQEEEKKRIEAERKAREEELKRKEAERKEKEEREKREKAEADKNKAELEKLRAENEKLKAEREKAEEERKRKKAESEAKKRKEQVSRYKASETIEYKDLRDSNHIIGVYSDDIAGKILLLKRQLDDGELPDKNELLGFIRELSFVNDKISTITRFTTKSNYLKAMLETKEDIVGYIKDYVNNSYKTLYTKMSFTILTNENSFVMNFHPIELCTALDNILNNSQKKESKKIIYEFSSSSKDILTLSIKDIGKPLSKEIKDWKLIFEDGITTTRGSGSGLANVKKVFEENMRGNVVYNPNYKEGFELIITLKK